VDRSSGMTRRRFAQGAGSCVVLAACGPLPFQARQPPRPHRIGFLGLAPEPYYDGLRQGLREHGYVDGHNAVIEWRYADGREERLPDLAADLVRLPVDVIVAAGLAPARAAKAATSTIPIVLGSSNDPVATGLVPSLARPGGNITGITNTSPGLSGKQLQILRDAVPGIARVALLWNAADPGTMLAYQGALDGARALGLKLQEWEVRRPEDFENVFDVAARQPPDALFTLRDSLTNTYRARILDFAATSRLPTMSGLREFAVDGGFLAYGPSLDGSYHRAALYVDKILKGAQPAHLPIEQPMRFDFVINLRTAQALGLTIPHHVLLQATEVIQ
jgi:putative tryptophan/tyrosine transport system substrate-binding protein